MGCLVKVPARCDWPCTLIGLTCFPRGNRIGHTGGGEIMRSHAKEGGIELSEVSLKDEARMLPSLQGRSSSHSKLGKIVDQNPMSQAIPCPMSKRCNCRAAHRSTNVGTRTVDPRRVDGLKLLFQETSHYPALGTPLGISAPYRSATMRISGQSGEAVPKEELTAMWFAASAFRSSYTASEGDAYPQGALRHRPRSSCLEFVLADKVVTPE